MRRAALISALILQGATAGAAEYRWPTTYGVIVTAHYDNNNGSGSALDWQCGGNSYSGHDGTDIGTPRFTGVYAGAGGWVKYSTDGYGEGYLGSTDGGGFGNHVAIFHGEGDESIYAHMTAGSGIPAIGATVSCGDFIGQSGNSGSSTGPHLHFETRVGVSETGSYYSGAADDPYAGPCSGPLSYWTNQDGGTPTTDCSLVPQPPVDDAVFVSETVPDGTHVTDGVPFEKTWRLRNTGTSVWGAGFQLVHVEGPDFGASAIDVGTVEPGAEVDLTLTMTATGSGTQRSTWRMAHDGAGFGEVFWVEVVVDPRPADDADGDGHGASGGDCDDGDVDVHPGATETCNGVDDDCSGAADEELVMLCDDGSTAVCTSGSFGACAGDDPDPSVLEGGCAAAGVSGGRTAGAAIMLGLIAIATLRARRRRA